MEAVLSSLPPRVSDILKRFIETCKTAFKDNLVSVVLYGSAAEGRMRATSDVNVILVLKKFELEQVDQIREDLRLGRATIQLGVMFLLENEVMGASESFAVKFNDILHRHQILHGSDPFANLRISREATVQRLRQTLFNLELRMRERYAMVSLREEQLILAVADFASPVRVCAQTLLELKGEKPENPKEALRAFAKTAQGDFTKVLEAVSHVRETRELEPGEATPVMKGLMTLVDQMQLQVRGF